VSLPLEGEQSDESAPSLEFEPAPKRESRNRRDSWGDRTWCSHLSKRLAEARQRKAVDASRPDLPDAEVRATGGHSRSQASVPLENLEASERARFILLHNLFSDAHFFQDTPRHSAFDLSLARCPRIRELGFASSNRRASAVGEKAPEIDRWGPHVVGLSFPRLA